LNHPLKNVVQALRKIVLSVDEEIAEQIKWNSPSFYYTGAMKPFDPKEYKRDIVVFNLHKNDCVLLVSRREQQLMIHQDFWKENLQMPERLLNL